MCCRRAETLTLVTLTIAATSPGLVAQDRAAEPASRSQAAVQLAPTSHPPLPGHPSLYWLVPETTAGKRPARAPNDPGARFAKGAALIAQGDFAAGLPLVTHADLAKTPLANYADYYAGTAQL